MEDLLEESITVVVVCLHRLVEDLVATLMMIMDVVVVADVHALALFVDIAAVRLPSAVRAHQSHLNGPNIDALFLTIEVTLAKIMEMKILLKVLRKLSVKSVQ